MKCFVLSLHRCGTRATTVFLRHLGLTAVHWPAILNGIDLQTKIRGMETDLDLVFATIRPAIEPYTVASDVPIPVLYRQLLLHYPDAKFLLLHRDPVDWVRSVRAHMGERRFHPFECVQYWQYFPDRPAGHAEITDEKLASMHRQHTESVSGFFERQAAGRLRILDLYDPETASEIAAFLDCRRQPLSPESVQPALTLDMFRQLKWRIQRSRGYGEPEKSE